MYNLTSITVLVENIKRKKVSDHQCLLSVEETCKMLNIKI